MTSVDLDIIGNFREKFSFLKDEPIVLYGIGEKTKVIIENLPEYNFIGLLDKTSVGYDLFGVPVIDVNEAIQVSKNIIIIANYSSAHIIYKRIAYLQISHNVSIFHMNGEKLDYSTDITPQLSMQSLNELVHLISCHSVISFDFFDTLVVRKAIFPGDIFYLVQMKIGEMLNLDIDFTSVRIEAEKIALSNFGKSMCFDHIYDILKDKLKLSNSATNQIKELEISVEISLLQPRIKLVEMINELYLSGKKVLITSDMYFSKKIMKTFAQSTGINEGIKINVSCEYGMTKYHGDLWQYYLTLYQDLKILHIGDDDYADIEQAKKYDISTFKIFSIKEMFERSSMRSISENLILSAQDRILLGTFIGKLYNDPFILSDNKKVQCNSMFDIGYLFYGPLVFNYMKWLVHSCMVQNINKILFISRDGFILNRLFKHMKNLSGNIEGEYFYTSRRALSVTSIYDKSDIEDVFNTFFVSRKITYERFLNTAFGIRANTDDLYREEYLFHVDKNILLEHTLNMYADKILLNATQERIEYLSYIEQSKIEKKDTFAVINFVSNGVTQYFFEKLLPMLELQFFYFLTKVEMKNMNINFQSVQSLYGEYLSSYTSANNSLIKHFLTAEAVFSSPDGQFIKFVNGNPTFNTKEKDFIAMEECHDGIEAFFLDLLSVLPNNFQQNLNVELIDNIFGTMFDDTKIHINENIKEKFSIEDDYASNKKVEGLW